MLNAWIPVGRPTGIPLCLHPSVKDVVIEPVNHVVILDTRGSAPTGAREKRSPSRKARFRQTVKTQDTEISPAGPPSCCCTGTPFKL